MPTSPENPVDTPTKPTKTTVQKAGKPPVKAAVKAPAPAEEPSAAKTPRRKAKAAAESQLPVQIAAGTVVEVDAHTVADLTEEIALQAYYIWLEEGRPDGASMDHWLRAESLVRMRREPEAAAA